jgi:UDP-N-acetylmuramoyl-L-alanyl-D-glutamate--2,6-diaminopimelate ligase
MPNKNIKHITADSKKVQKGSIFVAIKGYKVDGHDYILNAIEKGASTIILEDKTKIASEHNNKINFVVVPDSRIALAELASKSFEQPKDIVAVTGTSGKTSVANFVMQIIGYLGEDCASIGTLGVCDNRQIFNNRKEYQNLTTPDTIALHEVLEEIKANNIDYVVMEASSHGLAQHRLDGVHLKAAAFTSFSQDHLDYHANMEEYFAAKTLLFSKLLPSGKNAVLNSDITEFASLKNICDKYNHKILSYGKNGDFIKIEQIYYQNGENCIYSINNKKYEMNTKLLGEFQIYNVFAAVGLVYSCGFDIDAITKVLNKIKPVIGRMQRVGDSEVFIDYSHKPDALQKALKVMRENLEGKLILVFGCGGDRDSTKRPIMGQIAANYADVAIITDDNPRTENPSSIRKQILEACNNGIEIGDREKAIKYAIENMQKGDRVLIAGKGHETYQILKDKTIDFDDAKIAAKYL